MWNTTTVCPSDSATDPCVNSTDPCCRRAASFAACALDLPADGSYACAFSTDGGNGQPCTRDWGACSLQVSAPAGATGAEGAEGEPSRCLACWLPAQSRHSPAAPPTPPQTDNTSCAAAGCSW